MLLLLLLLGYHQFHACVMKITTSVRPPDSAIKILDITCTYGKGMEA